MSYNLRRMSDGEGETGGSSECIEWNEDRTFKSVISDYPTIGCSMKVGSVFARTYSNRDWWMTTPIVEIIEEINDEYTRYVKFKTENSEYEWWNGKFPK